MVGEEEGREKTGRERSGETAREGYKGGGVSRGVCILARVFQHISEQQSDIRDHVQLPCDGVVAGPELQAGVTRIEKVRRQVCSQECRHDVRYSHDKQHRYTHTHARARHLQATHAYRLISYVNRRWQRHSRSRIQDTNTEQIAHAPVQEG